MASRMPKRRMPKPDVDVKTHEIRFDDLTIEQAIKTLSTVAEREGPLTSIGKVIHGSKIPRFSVSLVMAEPISR